MGLANVWTRLHTTDPLSPRLIVNIVKAFEADMDEIAKANLPDIITQIWTLEAKGGRCDKCSSPWQQVQIDNAFCTATYYQPDCNCWPRCPVCLRILEADIQLGAKHCSYCGPVLQCPNWVMRDKTFKSGFTKKVNQRCRLNLQLSRFGYVCPDDDCGYSVAYGRVTRE